MKKIVYFILTGSIILGYSFKNPANEKGTAANTPPGKNYKYQLASANNVLAVDENLIPLADTAHYSLAPRLSPYVPTPIAVGELLFLFLDNGSVACLVLATGEVLWKERPAGPIYGSPICVNGKLYCLTKAGKVIVIRAQSTYELLGIHELGDESFSTPVMSGSGMVFRTFTRLMMLSS